MSQQPHFGTLIGHEGMDDMGDHSAQYNARRRIEDERRAQEEAAAVRDMCTWISSRICSGNCNQGRACDCASAEAASACTEVGSDDDQSESAGLFPFICIGAGCIGFIAAVALITSIFFGA